MAKEWWTAIRAVAGSLMNESRLTGAEVSALVEANVDATAEKMANDLFREPSRRR